MHKIRNENMFGGSNEKCGIFFNYIGQSNDSSECNKEIGWNLSRSFHKSRLLSACKVNNYRNVPYIIQTLLFGSYRLLILDDHEKMNR